MAGQELIALRQKVGNRKFQPTLRESMPWLAVSTAYLYIDYAEKFEARLQAILPTVGRIELATLPDPRDFEAAERTELFAHVRDKTGIQSADQLWLALGLTREPKLRGGDTSGSRKKLTPEAEHALFLQSAKEDFCRAFESLDQLHEKALWKSPSITDAMLETAADSAADFAKEARAWLKTPRGKRQS